MRKGKCQNHGTLELKVGPKVILAKPFFKHFKTQVKVTIPIHICQNSQNFIAQRMKLNVCKLKKLLGKNETMTKD